MESPPDRQRVSEYSTRYSIAIDAAQRIPVDGWRLQSQDNRQGSSGYLPADSGERLTAAERELHRLARQVYEERLQLGVAREQARKDLPLSTYTEAYWKIDLHNLLHFLSLRMDQHAQEEIRSYAEIIGYRVVAHWTPLVWEAFLDYRANAVHLSSIETRIIAALITAGAEAARALAVECGLLKLGADGQARASRERAELESKLRSFGLAVPW